MNEMAVREMTSRGQLSERKYDPKDLLARIRGVHRTGTSLTGCLPTQYRDLRRLDFSYTPSENSAILVRKNAVLISFDPIRAIVTADSLIVIVQNDLDTVSELITDQMKVVLPRGHHLLTLLRYIWPTLVR
jgi:hypothetical protein